MFSPLLWECVPNFIDSQGLEFEYKVQWNIENTIVGEKNIQRLQIDSFITYIYYKYAYGSEDYRSDNLHKRFIKKLSYSVFSETIV